MMPSESQIKFSGLPEATPEQQQQVQTQAMAAMCAICVVEDAKKDLQVEARYRGLLEAAPDGMVVVNESGEIVLMNAQAEKQFGYDRDELLGQKIKKLIPEGFAERLIADGTRTAAEALAQQIGTGIELYGLRKNGTRFPMEIMLSPLESPEGVLVTAAIRNISVRKDAEKHLGQVESQYRGLLEAAPDGMVVVNESGEIVLLNAQAEKQFGYDRDELLGQKIKKLIPEGFAERLIADGTRTAAEALAQQIGTGIELFGLRKNGTRFPIEILLSPLQSPEGILVTAAIRNISVRKDAEKHLGQVESQYRGLLEAAPDGMVVVNESGEIVLLNAQAENQFGYHRDELLGQKIKKLIPEGFAERLIADGTRTAAEALAQQIGTGIELYGLRKNGTRFPIEIMLSPLESPEGVLVTAAIRNISVRKDAEKHLAQLMRQIAHSAQHDTLTGLPNRLLLNDRLGQAIALAHRHLHQVVVMFLDLDGFKHINDSLGHPVGDKLLQSIAKRLGACVRAPDTISRQGGDEFIILLQEMVPPKDAVIVANRLLAALAETHSIGHHILHVTASIGVSVYPDDGLDAETLIRNADTAMYQAKETKRGSYKFFRPEMNLRAVERQSIEEDLRDALKRNEFALHYQPKINLKTGAITGAEALIRWRSSTRGLIPPLQFIPVAEDSGLILPIGAWVLREACTQERAWLDAGLPVPAVAVNVSAVQFENEKFLQDLFATLSETGLDPSHLELEVTETVLMKHAEFAASVLQILRNRGVRVSIDDFGMGYSSLSYLQKLPLDTLKIDQSFIHGINTNPGAASIVNAIINMGRSLNLRVIGEGVETAEDLAYLKAHDCDEVQGYYFSRPVPAEQLARFFERHNSLTFMGIPGKASGEWAPPSTAVTNLLTSRISRRGRLNA